MHQLLYFAHLLLLRYIQSQNIVCQCGEDVLMSSTLIPNLTSRCVPSQALWDQPTLTGCLCSATSSPCRFAVTVPPCRSTDCVPIKEILREPTMSRLRSRRPFVAEAARLTRESNQNGAADMGAVVDWRCATRTLCRDKPNVSTTWVHSTETSVRHSKSSAMWPCQMCRNSLPMGRDRITCLPLRREPPDHKAHCWRVPTHCIPWRPATSTRSGSQRSGMVIKTVYETMRVFQTNNNNRNDDVCPSLIKW